MIKVTSSLNLFENFISLLLLKITLVACVSSYILPYIFAYIFYFSLYKLFLSDNAQF